MAKQALNGYQLSKAWWDFACTTDVVRPVHSALYFFVVNLWNKLGHKDVFSLPTTSTMEAIGVSNYKTYSAALTDLVQWNFVLLVEKSRNQHTSSKVALVKNTKALPKANTEALYEATTQSNTQSTAQPIVSIDKPIQTIETIKPIKHYVNKIRVGVQFFEGTPFSVFKNEHPISYQDLLLKLGKITEDEFATSFNTQYLGIEFSNQNHLTNSIRKHLKTLSYESNKNNYSGSFKRQPAAIGTGEIKDFTTDGSGLNF